MVAALGTHDCGAGVFFAQLTGQQADDPHVPLPQHHDDVILHVLLRADLFLDLPYALALPSLPLRIEPVEFVGQLRGLSLVCRAQKPQRYIGRLQAAGDIDPRPQAKTQTGGIEGLVSRIGDPLERAQPEALSALEDLQTALDEQAIFPQHGHEISHRPQGH